MNFKIKNELNLKTFHFILLNIATFGIYTFIWLNDIDKVFKKISNISFRKMFIWLAVLFGVASVLDNSHVSIYFIFDIVAIISFILLIVWAFKAKKLLIDYALDRYNIDLKMNIFYTIIFHIYYINYCINSLSEEIDKLEDEQNIT